MGDVLPALELAMRLRADGHAVTVGAEPVYAELTRAHGLEWRPIGENGADAWTTAVREVLASDPDPGRRGAALVRRMIVPARTLIKKLVLKQVAEHDLTVVNGLLGFALRDLARTGRVMLWTSGPVLNAAEASLLRDAPFPILLSTSRHLFPEHAAIGGAAITTGFWSTSRLRTAPRAARRRVLMSLSSAGHAGVEAYVALARRVVEELACDIAVVDPACTSPVVAAPQLALIPPAPHAVLLDGVSCHVHQGGSGTVGETLHAGVPSVVLPQWADQPAFGARLVSLGLASDMILPSELTAERLIAAVRVTLDDGELLARCRAMGAMMAEEPGLELAARVVSEYLVADPADAPNR
jgi:hypothetical protein